MKRVLAVLPLALLASAGASAAPTEQPGTYKEAVLCSGLLSAATVFLTDEAQSSGDADMKEQADYAGGLQKRWVSRAITLMPASSNVMDDVSAQSSHFAQLFNQIRNDKEADIDKVLGDDLGACLDGGAKLPEN